MIGQTISHYKILAKIGEGGMGVVYKALDTRLDRTVALKFLPEHLLDDPSAKARFIQEAKGASAINHQNITTVYDIGEVDGKSFIAMEYVEGKTLKELAKEDLKLSRVLELAVQITEGLAAAHKKEIVHRDIKSENIMVTKENVTKIMDFGLAKFKDASGLTKTGATAGTLAYMSPEQTRGEEVDHRSDLFSFGVVLYEMIAGKLPFAEEHQAAVVYSIAHENPAPLARYKSDVPEGLQRIVDKALKKDKNLRYQNAADLLADLKGLQKEPTSGGVESAPKRKMLAVLPFENLGPAEDEYFADGITDEIITNLAKISGLGVISRTSAIKYKKTDKSLRQIATELGVDYVLEGTIRWDKSSSTNRVRINSQLIGVKDDTHLWAETYDRVLEQIFALQSDIAEKVTQALHITLLEPEQRSLEAMPTKNLEAYNYYLRGNDYFYGWEEKNLRIAVEMYQKAIDLDPNFALAYAMLSRVHSTLYWHWFYAESDTRLMQAKEAVDRALQLSSDLPEAHLALGYYFYYGNLGYDLALKQFSLVQKSQPNNSDVLSAIATIQGRKGDFNEALNSIIQASELDPRSSQKAYIAGMTYLTMRRYQDAEHYLNRAISLAPDSPLPYVKKARLYLSWEGNMEKAKKTLQDSIGKTDLVELVKQANPNDLKILFSILDDYSLETFNRLSEKSFGGDTSSYFLSMAMLYSQKGQTQPKHDCYNSARVYLETKIQDRPKEPYFHSYLGICYADIGRKDEAIREGKLAVELLPISKDAVDGQDWVENLAQIYTMVGEYEAAIDQLEYLLSIPTFFVSIPYLRLNPTWAPLRNHPRFKKLLAEK